MYSAMRAIASILLSAGLVVFGLWLWQSGPDLVLDWNVDRPELALWSTRGAALAAIAGAQAVVVAAVLGRAYRRGLFDTAVGFTATLGSVLAALAAVVCGLWAR